MYDCKLCKYKTNKISNYKIHLLSNKHNNKFIQCEDVLCSWCLKKFSTIGSMKRHKKYSCYLRYEVNDDKELYTKQEVKLIVLTHENNFLTEKCNIYENKYNDVKEQLEHSNKINISSLKIGMSALKLAQTHYSCADILYKIPNENRDKIINKDKQWKNYDLHKNLVKCHHKNKLYSRIGDCIVNEYKKQDKIKQSFWNTDTSRLTFIVMEQIKQEKDNKQIDIKNNYKIDNTKKWIIDKNGIKIRERIVKPIIDKINEIINDYYVSIDKNMWNDIDKDIDSMSEIINKSINELSKANKLLNSLDELENKIMKYIAPYFNIKSTE